MISRIRRAILDNVETLIGPNSNFAGNLTCDGNIRIDGVCDEGVIKTIGNIVIGPQARVAADLEAHNVSVSGTVTGKITATGRLEVLSTGNVQGEVSVGSILLDEAAFFSGKLEVKEESSANKLLTDTSNA